MKTTECLTAFIASLAIGTRALWIKIPPVKFSLCQRITCLLNGIVCSGIAVAKLGEASTVKMDSGNNGHNEKAMGIKNQASKSNKLHIPPIVFN